MSEQTVNVGAEGNSANEAFFDRFKISQICEQTTQ